MTAPQDDIPMPARAKVEAALATIDDDRTTADWNEIEEAARWALRVTPPERPVTDVRSEIIRLMREDFDPTPPNWEGRDWYDNADDVADKIIALFGSERPTQVSDEPCGVCGGSGNIFSQKFDREGNERVLRCPCKDGGFSINEAARPALSPASTGTVGREEIARTAWCAARSGRTVEDWEAERAASPNALEMRNAYRVADAILALLQSAPVQEWRVSQQKYRIEHDGFEGVQIGEYTTLEGKQGVVLQQIGTRVVHVYGRKWLSATK